MPPEGEKEKPQVHIMAADGGEARLVCKMPNGVSDLSWSPDGSRLAFISLEGEEPKSDPKVLAPSRHRRLWTVRPDQAIPEPVIAPGFTVWEYAWSPDSRQLALYYSTSSDDTDWYHSEIGVVASNAGAIRQLTHLTWQARGLAWSPDSRQIAYLSGRWSDPGRGSGNIFVVSLEDGQSRDLTPGIESSPAWCCWFPDGRHLLYTAVKGVTHQIGMLDSRDGTLTMLENDFVMQGDQPSLAITPDRHAFATVHSTSQQPPDVWFGALTYAGERPAGIEWKQLSRLNPLIEGTLPLPKTERINYESVDGWRIDALFTPPLQTKAGELPPLYVYVHGGPSGADCNDWYSSNPIFATAGFAILQPNMRGSWGHGLAFADAVLGDMGGKDFQDILNGVEYLVQQGRVDGKRVGIGGWSNGGFLSAWAITQTNRFKAAMIGAAITDWHGMHAQSNIPDADVLLLAADPLENPEVYRRCSPLTYANRVTTPALILHGEDDPAVPVAQAYTFYRALKERKVPVECVIYPRAGHGMSERDHLRDVYERHIGWFERYVK
jgi:dipeptidyl aminopeptidase/acylaminoacyl peptidase